MDVINNSKERSVEHILYPCRQSTSIKETVFFLSSAKIPNKFQRVLIMAFSTQNRDTMPPFYLEVYYRLDGRHNRPYQYEPREKTRLSNKLELYFWRDSNLKEVLNKITETIPFDDAKAPGAKYDFSVIFPDTRLGQFETKNLGKLVVDENSSDETVEPFNNRRFTPGDYIDVAITPVKDYVKSAEEKVEAIEAEEEAKTDENQPADEPKRLESNESEAEAEKAEEEKPAAEPVKSAEPDPLMDDDDDEEMQD